MRILIFLAAFLAGDLVAFAQEIVSARFAGPTREYAHGVLGDQIEYTRLVLRVGPNKQRRVFEAGEGHVFEDLEPRLADLNQDGRPEVIVVRTNMDTGASLAIYGVDGLITQTPPIGRPYRWLAPVGVGDFDQDGRAEIAYVETPHLGKVLKIYRYLNRELHLSGQVSGLSNHRIGDNFISGGVRNCGDGDEIITADGAWQRIVSTRMVGGILQATTIGTTSQPRGFERALACEL